MRVFGGSDLMSVGVKSVREKRCRTEERKLNRSLDRRLVLGSHSEARHYTDRRKGSSTNEYLQSKLAWLPCVKASTQIVYGILLASYADRHSKNVAYGEGCGVRLEGLNGNRIDL
jgi:hypothetical protein